MPTLAPPAVTGLGTLYVYGIAAAGVRAPRATGVAGSPVGLLTESGLCAAVSPAPERPRARRRDLLAHQAVLEELVAQGPVLPMRFAVLTPRPDTLRAQLRSDAARLKRQLDDIAGCVELNVKGTVVADCLAELVRRDEQLRTLALRARRRPGYDADVRLGEALAKAVRREARRAAREVLARLTPLAVRTADGPLDDGRVLSTSFLVRADDEPGFRREVAARARAHRDRLALGVTGPLPCYSFVEARPASRPAGR